MHVSLHVRCLFCLILIKIGKCQILIKSPRKIRRVGSVLFHAGLATALRTRSK